MGNINTPAAICVPPLQLDNLFEAQVRNQIEDIVGDHQGGRRSALPAGVACNRAKRLAMKMVEMSVRDQHKINHWKISNLNTWPPEPLQKKKPPGEIWIDNYILSSQLKKKTRVPDKSHPEFAVRNQPGFVSVSGKWRYGGVPYEPRELAGPPAQRPIL